MRRRTRPVRIISVGLGLAFAPALWSLQGWADEGLSRPTLQDSITRMESVRIEALHTGEHPHIDIGEPLDASALIPRKPSVGRTEVGDPMDADEPHTGRSSRAPAPVTEIGAPLDPDDWAAIRGRHVPQPVVEIGAPMDAGGI